MCIYPYPKTVVRSSNVKDNTIKSYTPYGLSDLLKNLTLVCRRQKLTLISLETAFG